MVGYFDVSCSGSILEVLCSGGILEISCSWVL